MSLVLSHARLADGRVLDVTIEGGRIVAIAPSASDPTAPRAPSTERVDLTGYLLLPSFVEPHAHLDKALTADLAPNPKGNLLGAIDAWTCLAATLSAADVAARAERAARELVASGVTTARTHVNVHTGFLSNIEALVTVRDRLRGVLDLQIVALTTIQLCGGPDAYRRTLRDATSVDPCVIVGGCPHLDDDPELATDISLDVAGDAGRAIDLHTDESLDPSSLHLPHFAARVRKLGFAWGATASHCVSLGSVTPTRQREVAESVADADVAVVTLPQTNLFLQGRDLPQSTPRGLTALRALLGAGVTLAAGADNVRDPFNTMGRSDPMETAALLVMAGHLSADEAYAAVSAGARAALGIPSVAIEVGAPADLVAIAGDSLNDAVARADVGRMVWKDGRMVARTTLDRFVGP